jgi:hypothetical protein
MLMGGSAVSGETLMRAMRSERPLTKILHR